MADAQERFLTSKYDAGQRRMQGVYFTIIRPSLAEFFGVFFLAFCSYCPVAITYSLRVSSIAVVFAYIGVYSITRTISGGQLNPVITLIQVITKSTPLLVGLCYLAVQLLGGILGALSVEAVTSAKPDFVKPRFGTGHAIFAEMVGSLIVYLAYLTLTNKSKGNTAILGIGFGYAGALLTVISATGGFLNPALNFGIAVASGTWTKHYVYWIGTALGGTVATILHGLVFASEDSLWVKPGFSMPERL